MTAPSEILALVPAFNEAASVGAVVTRLRALGHPVCVIDDGSTDSTAAEAAGAGAEVLRLPVNLGVGGALRCGFRHAVEEGYQTVAQVDADGQHDVEQIARLAEALEATGADLAIGSRFAAGGSYAVSGPRRLSMRILARRVSRVLGQPVTDATSGFRVIHGRLLYAFARSYPVEYLGDTVEALVLAARAGAKVIDVPITMRERETGTPSAGRWQSVWYVLRVMAAIELYRPGRRPGPLRLDD